MPNHVRLQEVHEFDVVGHPRADFHFCVTFPFHPAEGSRPAEVRPWQAGAAHCALGTVLGKAGVQAGSGGGGVWRAAGGANARMGWSLSRLPQCQGRVKPVHDIPPAALRAVQVTLLREYCQGPNTLGYSLPAGAYDRRKHASYLECAQAELSEEVGAGCWAVSVCVVVVCVCVVGGGGDTGHGQAAMKGAAGQPFPPFHRLLRHSQQRPLCGSHSAPLPQALLAGGEWAELLPAGHLGVPEVKWCANRFTPFLCIAPAPDAAPGARDTEEFIQVGGWRAGGRGSSRGWSAFHDTKRTARPALFNAQLELSGMLLLCPSPAPRRPSIPAHPAQVLRVSIPELRRIMRSGDMMLPSVVTCYWALDELAHRGHQL